MKIGLFGGSFNPPHKGHIRAAEHFCKEAHLDRLIIMPAGDPPHKRLSPGADDLDRLNMSCIAFRGIPNSEVSDYEINAFGESFTVLTLRRLKELYPDDSLTIYIGDDMFLSFQSWENYREILKLAELFVMLRTPGITGLEEMRSLLEAEGGRITLSDAPPEKVSSSEIREELKKGVKPEGLTDGVFDYIERNGLYRANE